MNATMMTPCMCNLHIHLVPTKAAGLVWCYWTVCTIMHHASWRVHVIRLPRWQADRNHDSSAYQPQRQVECMKYRHTSSCGVCLTNASWLVHPDFQCALCKNLAESNTYAEDTACCGFDVTVLKGSVTGSANSVTVPVVRVHSSS